MGFDFLDWGFPKSGTDWKSINGKPFITVSSKGRSNGLSTKINDGADFGPDTTLNAMSPSQTGPSYTQTSGIQEALDYIAIYGYHLLIKTGYYKISAPILPQPSEYQILFIEGEVGNVYSFTNGNNIGVIIELDNNYTTINGLPAIFGTPNVTSNGGVHIENIAITQPYITSTGVTATAFDFSNCQGNNYFKNCVALTSIGESGSGPPTNSNNIPAFRISGTTIFERCYAYNYQVGFLATALTTLINSVAFQCYNGMFINTAFATDHPIYLLGFDVEQAVNMIYIPTATAPAMLYGFLTYETSTATQNLINDVDNVVYGEIFINGHEVGGGNFSDFNAFTAKTGGNNLKVHWQFPIPSPTLLDNPPVSGTVYQNTNGYDIRLKIPVTYNPTSTAAATLATGISSTSTVTTSTKVSIPAGLTAADGQILTYDMVVPAGWYYELVATNATIGTAEVQPI